MKRPTPFEAWMNQRFGFGSHKYPNNEFLLQHLKEAYEQGKKDAQMPTPSVNRSTSEKAHYLRRLAERALSCGISIQKACPWWPDLAFIAAWQDSCEWLTDLTVEESALFALFVAEFLDTDGELNA